MNKQENFTTFKFENVDVRLFKKQDESVWFVASDLAKVFSVKDANRLTRLLDDDEKGPHIMGTPGGTQETTIVSESGFYSLVLRSRKPEAKRFKKWVTSEVLPSIRKSGQYVGADPLLKSIADTQSTLINQAIAAKPAVDYFNLVLSATNVVSIPDAAIQLKIGRNTFYSWLRQKEYLRDNNMPYQRHITSGLFHVNQDLDKDEKLTDGKTFLTQKGMTTIGAILAEEMSNKNSDTSRSNQLELGFIGKVA